MIDIKFFRNNYLSFYLPALVLLIETMFLFLGSSIYLGEGYLTVEAASSRLLLIAPVIAGSVAFDAARLRTPEHFSMYVTAPRRWLVDFGPFLWAAGTGSLIHCAVLLGTLIQGRVLNPSVGFPAILFMMLVQCVTIVLFAAMGYAVGAVLSPSLAGGVSTIGAYLVLTIFGPVGPVNIFSVTGANIPQIGMTWNLCSQQIRLGIVLVMIGLLLFGNFSSRKSRLKISRPVVILPLLVALSVGPIFLDLDYKSDLDVRADRDSCASIERTPSSQTIEICLFNEHRAYLPEFVGALEFGIKTMDDAKVSIDLASTWHELAWGQQVGESSSNPQLQDTYYFQIPLSLLEGQGVETVTGLEEVAHIISFPSTCSIDRFNQAFDSSVEGFVEAQALIYNAINDILMGVKINLSPAEVEDIAQAQALRADWCEAR